MDSDHTIHDVFAPILRLDRHERRALSPLLRLIVNDLQTLRQPTSFAKPRRRKGRTCATELFQIPSPSVLGLAFPPATDEPPPGLSLPIEADLLLLSESLCNRLCPTESRRVAILRCGECSTRFVAGVGEVGGSGM